MQTNVKNRGRRQLLGIMALFLLPPVLAWIAWYYLDTYGVSTSSNAGTLIQPARPLSYVGLMAENQHQSFDFSVLQGRWYYVLYAGAGCRAACQEQLYVTRQIRIGVNKDIPRVKRLLITKRPLSTTLHTQLTEQHPDLFIARQAVDDTAEAWLKPFQGANFDASGDYYFLVDPIGNVMMFYDAQVPPKGILRDLQKLLKVSQVG